MKINYTCNLCGSEHLQILYSDCYDRFNKIKGKFDIIRCLECKLIFIDPIPTIDEINNFYQEDYSAYQMFNTGSTIISKFKGLLKKLLLSKYYFSLPKPNLNQKLLDVGFGIGKYLKDMEGLGWEVYGTEISEYAIKKAREIYKLKNIFKGELKDINFKEEYFDLVVLQNTLEHMIDPFGILKEINKTLKKDGRIIIVSLDINSLESKLFGEYWYGFDVPRHIFCFTRETLKRSLLLSGFKIEKVKNIFFPILLTESLQYTIKEFFKIDLKHNKHRFFYYVLCPVALLFCMLNTSGCVEIQAKKL